MVNLLLCIACLYLIGFIVSIKHNGKITTMFFGLFLLLIIFMLCHIKYNQAISNSHGYIDSIYKINKDTVQPHNFLVLYDKIDVK